MESLETKLIMAGLSAGQETRRRINALPLPERAETMPSHLKGEKTKKVDALGEEIAIEYFERLSLEAEVPVRLVLDPVEGSFYDVESGIHGEVRVNVYLDPVDGTIKIAGLGNDGEILRMVNDGAWGFGASFTDPTEKGVDELGIGEFSHSVIIDGNPAKYPTFPTNAFTYGNKDGDLRTYEILESRRFGLAPGMVVPLCTSSQENISQGTIGFDAFQGYDRKTAQPGTEELIREVYARLSNRNEGGAFDLVRIYGDFGDILRGQLGYERLESQGVARVSVNNHLGNAVPIYAIMRGAGGTVVDFSGNDMGKRKISEGRTNMVSAANPTIERKVLDLINS